MPDNLTDGYENLALDWLNGVGSPARPVGPLQVALITTTTPSTDSTNGSEVTGGSYTRQPSNLASATGGLATNSNAITFTNMPACIVGGIELWDNNATPASRVRVWHGTLAQQKTVNAGDTFTIAAGDLDITLG